MTTVTEKIRRDLFAMQDLPFRDFQAKLMPTVEKDAIIGVRTPELRKYAGKQAADPEIEEFLDALPHRYFEENNVHAFVIEKMKDYGKCIQEVERFLPYIDNWATCDLFSPRVFARHKKELLEMIRKWIASEDTYTVRFGVGMLMRFYLDGDFKEEYLELAAGIRSEEYYVNMMIAWYFATALAKQYDAVLPFLEDCRLDEWTHNKAIQKACESRRISAEQKAYLRTLKVKNTRKGKSS